MSFTQKSIFGRNDTLYNIIRLSPRQNKVQDDISPEICVTYGSLTPKIGSLTPKIAESLIWLIFFNKFKFLVDRTAVLCYNTIIVQKGNVVYEIKN